MTLLICVHSPVIQLPVRDKGADADNRVVDVLRKLVADRLADLDVRLADEIVCSREPAEVGHSLQSPTITVGFMTGLY
jgi:hypothetical protein